MTITYKYQPISIGRTYKGVCPICKKRVTRCKKFS